MRRLLLLLSLSLACISQVLGQVAIKGTVKDETNNPIPGVTVIVKGTKSMTSTDGSGNFSIAAAQGTTLIFRDMSHQQKEVVVSGNFLTVSLSSSTRSIGEVVVTSLGITKQKRTLNYATQTVGVEELSKARELNVANSLAGKVAGLEISRTASGLGGSSRVTLRGDRSISGNNQALIVVDGVPIDNTGGGPTQASGGATARDLGDGISSINPDDIASINVLKGASATALYGSRAANGAIIITTKKGREGKGLGISYTGSYQIEQPMILRKFQNEYGQGAGGSYSPSSEGSWGPKFDGKQVPTWSKDPADAGKTSAYAAQPNNYKDFYSNGNNLVNGIALNGGTGKTQVYFSYTNTNARGIVENNKLKRNNFNLRMGNQFGERWFLDAKVNYLNQVIDNRMRTTDAFDNVNRHILRVPRNISTADMGNYDYVNAEGFTRQNYWNPGSNGGANPYWTMNNNPTKDERNRLIGFASLTYKVLPGLSAMLRTGMDRYTDNSEQKWNNDTYIIAANGNYVISDRQVLETNTDFLLTYDKQLSSNFTINANVGGNIQKNKIVTTETNDGSLVIENLFVTGNAASLTTTRSIYQREKHSLYATTDIGYKNWLTLTLTGRNDWSSTLPANNCSYFFPSAGLAVVLSDMLKLPAFVSFAKLRGSLAQTGNDADPYNLVQTYSAVPGGNGVMIGRDGRLPIPGLKPELTTAQELGLDVKLFDSRAGFELTWYNSHSKNQLLPVTLPAASGWTSQFINAGNIQNSGMEVTFNVTPVKTSALKWDVTLNYAKNNNKVVEITPDLKEFVLTTGNDFMNTVKVVEGKPFGELYSRGYVRDASGKIMVDANGLPLITPGQTVYLGNTRPDWTGSIMNKVSYKNMYLSFVISARMGGVVSSFTDANIYADGVAAGTLVNRDGYVFDGVLADGSKNGKMITAEQYWKKVGGRNTPAGEVFTYDASTIRLRELVLGCNLPKNLFRKLPFQNANVSITGRNLFFLRNGAKTFDPEMSVGSADRAVGIEAFAPPTTRSMGINLNLSF